MADSETSGESGTQNHGRESHKTRAPFPEGVLIKPLKLETPEEAEKTEEVVHLAPQILSPTSWTQTMALPITCGDRELNS